MLHWLQDDWERYLASTDLNYFEIQHVLQRARTCVQRSPLRHVVRLALSTFAISTPLATILTLVQLHGLALPDLPRLFLLMLLISTAFMLPPGSYVSYLLHQHHVRRVALALARDLTILCCGNCGYEIRPLDTHITTCPECGSQIIPRGQRPKVEADDLD